MRWTSKTLGFVSPDEFILVAEQAGLIGAVTDWVVKRAINDTRTFVDNNIEVCVAINLSAKDILNKSLLPQIKSRIAEAELSLLSFPLKLPRVT